MSQILPPFTKETAQAKVKAAQSLWNTRDPEKVVQAYTADSIWRNRDQFLRGHDEIRHFLVQKWKKETRYRLRKELFAFMDNKIAVQFWYEYFNEEEQCWFRCYGLEDWTFDYETGKMQKRQMSGNEIRLEEGQRWFNETLSDDEVDRITIGPEHW